MNPTGKCDPDDGRAAASEAPSETRREDREQVSRCRWMLTQRSRELLQMTRSEQRHRQFAEALLGATLALNASLDRDEVLDGILEQTQRILRGRAAAIVLIRDEVVCMARYRGLDGDSAVSSSLAPGFCLKADPALPAEIRSFKQSWPTDASGQRVWRFIPGLDWVRSSATVAMRGRDEVIGLLGVFSERPDAFDRESMDFLDAFAAHAVLAIQNAEVHAAGEHARQVAEILSAASLALTRTLDLDTVLHTLLDYLSQLAPYDHAHVMLLQDQTHLTVEAARSRGQQSDGHDVQGRRIDVGRIPFLHQMLTTREGLLIPDTAAYPGWEHPGGLGQVSSWLGVPLVAEGGVIGVCGLDKGEPGFYTPAHLALATALVRQAAVAVQNARLFRQVSEARQRLQALSQRLVEVQEAERRYIARELHDEAGQALTSLAVRLRLLTREADRPEAIVAKVAELMDTVETVSEDLHRLAMALRPPSLEHLGLAASLRQYVESIGQRHGLAVRFEAIGLDKRHPVDLETALYRIVQEALTNVVRHAGARRVDIVLEQLEDRLIVIVEDDGRGFDLSAPSSGDHLGLIGIRERAEMLGGRLALESTPGGGTTLLVEAPYASAHSHR